jgi:hypothetical protein
LIVLAALGGIYHGLTIANVFEDLLPYVQKTAKEKTQDLQKEMELVRMRFLGFVERGRTRTKLLSICRSSRNRP